MRLTLLVSCQYECHFEDIVITELKDNINRHITGGNNVAQLHTK